MSSSTDLPSADMYALLQLIGDAADDDPGPALPWALLDGLRALHPLRGDRLQRVRLGRASLCSDPVGGPRRQSCGSPGFRADRLDVVHRVPALTSPHFPDGRYTHGRSG